MVRVLWCDSGGRWRRPIPLSGRVGERVGDGVPSGGVGEKAHRGRWRTLKDGRVVVITGTPRAPRGGVAAWGSGKEREERRRGGIYDVVSETDEEGAKVLLTQGVEPSFKPRIGEVGEYAPGRGLEREGLYVSDAEASSKGSFGRVRLYMSVGQEHLASPREMRQLGRTDLDDVLATENGAVTRGRLPRDVFKVVEVSDGRQWTRMSPGEYLKSVGVDVAKVPKLPTVGEYSQWVRRNAQRFRLSERQVEDTIHWYNRGTLQEKVSMAQEAGLAGVGEKAVQSTQSTQSIQPVEGRWCTLPSGGRVLIAGLGEGVKAKGRWRTLKDGRRILVTGKPSVSAMRSGVGRYLGVQPGGEVEVLSTQDFDDRFGMSSQLHGGIAAITTSEGTYLKEGLESDAVHELIHQAGFMPEGIGEFLNEGMTQAAARRAGEETGIDIRDTYGKETRFVERYVLPSVGVGEREFFRGYAKAEDKGQYVVDLVWKTHGDKFSNVEDWGIDPRGRMLENLPRTLGTDSHLAYLVDEAGVGKGTKAKGRWVTLPDGRRVMLIGGVPGGAVEQSDKARGRGGRYGRWRTLKDGRRVFVSGGTPIGGLSVRTGSGMMDRTLFDTFGDVDPAKVDKLIHDFEGLPSWAIQDISNVEIYEREGYEFRAGGEDFRAGMDYTHSMGRIRVWNANDELSPAFTNEGIYHEVGHNLDRRWRDSALAELDAVWKEHPGWIDRRGLIKKEHQRTYAQEYPLADARRRWLEAWDAGQDGITSYSKAWAREGNSGETIAEFAQYYFGGYGRGGPKVSRRNVSKIGGVERAPDLARAFADAMEALAKG